MARSWPISSDYAEAVQIPDLCCADPDLRSARAATNAMGLPLSCSGTFGDVYQFQSPDGIRQWAVKCFTKPMAQLKERYREISAHLEQARLPFTVEFKYLDEGLLVRGDWYPVLKMDWVEGISLNKFAKACLDQPETLRVLLRLWAKVEQRLRLTQVTHADLQHGNILLVPDHATGTLDLKLVDYDGMWIPSLIEIPSQELGHPDYQHPLRCDRASYSAEVDRFSHLVIVTALRALASPTGRQLWRRFDRGDNVLFRKSDFLAPTESALLRELWQHEDEPVRTLAGRTILAAQGALRDVPTLEDILDGDDVIPLSREEQERIRQAFQLHAPEPTVISKEFSLPLELVRHLLPRNDVRAPSGLAGQDGLPTPVPSISNLPTSPSIAAAPKSVGTHAVQTEEAEQLPRLLTSPFGKQEIQTQRRLWSDRLQSPVDFQNSIDMRFVLIPPGIFLMGASPDDRDADKDEKPQHQVLVSQPFYMAVYPVTQREYQAVTGKNPSHFFGGWLRKGGLDHPVERVEWTAATNYCQALGELSTEREAGRRYRLPTEAEWEYACRSGTLTPFSFGESLCSRQANFNGQHPFGGGARGPFLGATSKVGNYAANAFGLYDMHGNVWEWCFDWYGRDYYASSPRIDPNGPASGKHHVLRGGAWSAEAQHCISSYRRLGCDGVQAESTRHPNDHFGFRIVCDAHDSITD